MQVSGHVIRSRYMFVRTFGDDAYQAVLAKLGPVARQVFEEGPLETVWYPYDVLLDISVVTDELLGEGDLALCETMGAYSCEHNLTGIFRVFFRFGNLNFLLERAAKAWRSQYDFGAMEVRRDPDNRYRLTLELKPMPRPHRALYLAIKGWAIKAAELSGSEMIEFIDGYSDDPEQPWLWSFVYR